MTTLTLDNPHYQNLEASFKQWLQTLGYSESSITYRPVQLREFLHYLEGREVQHISEVTKEHITAYFFHLKTRKCQRRSGTLSNSYINGQSTLLKTFNRYLVQVHELAVPLYVQYLEVHKKPTVILTREEVQRLYGAADGTRLGIRDRAMLAVYYGCGLRNGEGIRLNIGDIDQRDNLLHIRKAKNFKERLVPMTANVKTEIMNYLQYGRPLLDKGKEAQALFITRRGVRPYGDTALKRVKELALQANISKNIGVHTLRHSIATHLLQSGMKLEYISRFLGHSSLEPTQIYTHIINELEA